MNENLTIQKQQDLNKIQKPKNIQIILFILFFAILILVSVFLIQIYQKNKTPKNTNENTDQTTKSASEKSLKEVNIILNEYKNKNYELSKEVKIQIPQTSEVLMKDNNMEADVVNNDFTISIKTIYDRTGVFLEEKLNKVKLNNNNFEGDLYRVYYNNNYIYSNRYGESANGDCIGYEPTPVACLLDMAGPFIITCNPNSELFLEECDKIVESLQYESLLK